jgi:hypothetical protein
LGFEVDEIHQMEMYAASDPQLARAKAR